MLGVVPVSQEMVARVEDADDGEIVCPRGESDVAAAAVTLDALEMRDELTQCCGHRLAGKAVFPLEGHDVHEGHRVFVSHRREWESSHGLLDVGERCKTAVKHLEVADRPSGHHGGISQRQLHCGAGELIIG